MELIGADYDAIRRAEDRQLFSDTMEKAGLRVPRSAVVESIAEAERALPDIGLPAIVRPGFTMGGEGGGIARTERRVPRARGRGPGREPDPPGADRRVGDRLGRVRARADARPQRQRRGRLLDRERGPDGRPHRRLGHRRAPADAERPALPGAARPGDQGDPGGRCGDRRLEHPVRGAPGHRRDRGDRDEPARVALERARVEGHRLPDREDRRPAGGGLHARRDRQRHHARDARQLRAHDRLRGGEVAAVRVREVPRRRRLLSTHMQSVGEAMAIGRTFKQAFAKALRSRELDVERTAFPDDLLAALETPVARPLRVAVRGDPAGGHRGGDLRAHRDRPVVHGRDRAAGPRRGPAGGAPALLQGRRHLRRRVRGRHARTSTPAGSARRGTRWTAARGRAW